MLNRLCHNLETDCNQIQTCFVRISLTARHQAESSPRDSAKDANTSHTPGRKENRSFQAKAAALA